MQCLDNPLPYYRPLPSPYQLSLVPARANAHASNRRVLKLIHSKPAALRVVYYKSVFTEPSPPDEACTSTASPYNPYPGFFFPQSRHQGAP